MCNIVISIKRSPLANKYDFIFYIIFKAAFSPQKSQSCQNKDRNRYNLNIHRGKIFFLVTYTQSPINNAIGSSRSPVSIANID